MNKTILSKLTPHIVAVLLFIILSFFYFKPILEGKQLIGHDTASWLCMAKETMDYNQTHDQPTLWTNSMFGGMPTYQISMGQPYNIMNYVDSFLRIFPNTVYYLMLYFIGFYILLLGFRVNPWLAIAGAIAFSFASYNFIIIAAGHNSKAVTIAYMAPLIGGVFMAFRRNKLLGSLVTAVFLSLAIRANHVQILYYTLIILLFFGVVELVYTIKNKTYKSFLQSSGMVILAAVIALGINATSLLTTYEYSQYTMRGQSNGLTTDTQNSQHGLNKDYITQWSYGIGETMTLLIPDFKGGASGGYLDDKSETAEKIKSMGAPNVDQIMKENQFPLYWGDQPGTSGPVYLGAIVILLFVLSFFVVDKRILWWLVPMIILTLMLSWGRNFMGLTDFFINHVPMYNKFRTVSMTLVATGFGITLLAVLALKEVLDPKRDKSTLLRPLYISAGIVGGIALLFALIPSLAGSFVAPTDAQLQGGNAFLKETLPMDRMALLRSDAFRSFGFVLIASLILWLYLKDKLKINVVVAMFGILFLVDLMPVDKRYLNDSNFERKSKVDNMFEPSNADNMVLQDKSQYRVLDATVNLFNDATPSYFHKNIGGYHAAKLRRYQELINMQLDGEIGQLFGAFGRAKSFNEIAPVLDSLGVLNMLNMKYIIYNKDAAPMINPYANGNAWFVNQVKVAATANDEMKTLGEINTKHELVVDKEYASMIPAKLVDDTTAHIALKSYEPNHLVYTFQSKTDQLAVFSEIYYDKGWNAYINGQKVPYFRADYLLRAMPLKAGDYEIEFKFEPLSYKVGTDLALGSSIILILSLLGFVFWQIRKSKKS